MYFHIPAGTTIKRCDGMMGYWESITTDKAVTYSEQDILVWGTVGVDGKPFDGKSYVFALPEEAAPYTKISVKYMYVNHDYEPRKDHIFPSSPLSDELKRNWDKTFPHPDSAFGKGYV